MNFFSVKVQNLNSFFPLNWTFCRFPSKIPQQKIYFIILNAKHKFTNFSQLLVPHNIHLLHHQTPRNIESSEKTQKEMKNFVIFHHIKTKSITVLRKNVNLLIFCFWCSMTFLCDFSIFLIRLYYLLLLLWGKNKSRNQQILHEIVSHIFFVLYKAVQYFFYCYCE